MIRSRTLNRRLALLASTLMLAPQGVFANPLGGQVVGGQATIQGQGTSTVTVTQGSQNAILNWNTFNIGAGELTQFNQPNASAVALNRVIGGLGPSQIDGKLTANGQVFLVNPYGFLFGSGASINTAGFLATTHDIANADFMAGNYKFTIPGQPNASIVNLGTITATNGGFAALVAPGVRNAGVITANLGHVALASGNGFTLDFYGDKLITLQVGDQIASQVIDVATNQPLNTLVKNEGTLRANGGQVALTAAAARQVVDSVINNTGVIEANSVGTKNGMIVLGAATAATKGADAAKQTVKVAGTLKASGQNKGEKGGVIQVTGEDIQVAGAKLDASGQAGGGTVLIGGDTGGGTVNAAVSGVKQAQLQPWAVPTASSVSIDAATVIDASAKAIGDGGKVVVWSNQATKFAGTIYATGGATGGNGGFAEVSSHGVLSYTGLANLSAAKGTAGTLLLDPANVLICDDCEGQVTIDSHDLSAQLGNQDVIVTTDKPGEQQGNITVDAPLTWSGTHQLTLDATNNINIYSPITALSGGLTISAGHNINPLADVKVNTFTLQKGFWNQIGIDELPAFSANDFRITGGTFLRALDGNGSTDSPYQITDVYGLQGIGSPSGSLLNKNFVLANNIDASGTQNWNGGAGFVPIGSPGNRFGGTFDGSGYQVDGLKIAPVDPNIASIGLFGANNGIIQNVQLTNVLIKANPNVPATNDRNAGPPGQFVGALVGQNFGLVSNASASGQIDGQNIAGVTAGGLVGQNGNLGQDGQNAQITYSHADVKVTLGDGISCFGNSCNGGWNNAGGLVGFNAATIDNSWATGNVTVGANSFAGGLVGSNQNSTAGIDNQSPQAMVGPTITDSWASGNVTSNGANVSLGGLVGYNAPLAVIATSFAQGNVTSTASVSSGGNDCSATNSCQFANVGGLVGQNQGTISGFATQDSPVLTDALVTNVATGCGTCLTWASGTVSVGSGGTAGGLVGFNDGIIKYAFATGNVTGAAGVDNGKDSFGRSTNLGGLVGSNQGWIDWSFAGGNVGAPGVAFLQVGGLVGDNGGKITNSFAAVTVQAGDHSQAGGLAGSNGAWDNSGPTPGDGYKLLAPQNQFGVILKSGAIGSVSVGDSSLAGGFVGGTGNFNNSMSNNARIDQSFAIVAVSGGSNSILGGFAGVQDIGATISNSTTLAMSNPNKVAIGDAKTFAISNFNTFTSTVTSTGEKSVVGGFIGVNGGQILNSNSVGPVNGTSNSYLGGFVGINVGSVQDSTASGNVTGSGNSNVVGGFAAVNAGAIDPSFSSGSVGSGSNSIVGAFVGANGPFTNLPTNLDPNLSFPGTIDSGSKSTNPGNNPQVGFTPSNSGNAGLPSILGGCSATLCQVLVFGLGSSPPPTDNTTPTFSQQWFQQVGPPPNQNDNTPIQINLTTGDPGLGGPAGGNGGNGGSGGSKPNYGPPPGPGLGRTADEQQYSGVPPPGETRFRIGELVIQVVDTVPIEQVVNVAQGLGLALISVEHLDQTHRNAFRFRATNPKADYRRLIARLEKVNVFASVQPNYNFITAQTAPTPAAPPTVPAAPAAPAANNAPPNEAAPDLANSDTAALTSLPAGDAAQYVIDKFHLGAVHRLASGRNVTIAVIDSEIDAAHADLRGSIIERFDATQTPSKPHAHGTGMAGAIVSRARLLGVAPGARILAIKAFDESATSAEATSFQILKGLDYAISKNVRIINMSFAGPRDPMMERTLKAAHDKGIILIAAAGNAGPKSPPLYPGADASVIAVSASDFDDKPFTMANRGKYIAVAAPGVDVMVPAPANTYQLTTGTSVAAAHVSGVAALILERKPTITPDELRALLMKTATAFSAKPKGEEDGAGLVDPAGALQALAGAKTSDAVPSRSPVSASVH